MAAAYLLPRWVKWPHVGKNVTLFSYMVMQHAAHLEIYPLGGTWLVQERKGKGEGRAMLIRCCGSYGTHCYRPRHGRIVEIAGRSFPSSIYSFGSRAIRFLTLGTRNELSSISTTISRVISGCSFDVFLLD